MKMAQVNAICTNCKNQVIIDSSKDAEICPHCASAFVSEKAIALYEKETLEKDEKLSRAKIRKRRWKNFASVMLLVLECIGTIIYFLFFVWLFFDFIDGKKKK